MGVRSNVFLKYHSSTMKRDKWQPFSEAAKYSCFLHTAKACESCTCPLTFKALGLMVQRAGFAAEVLSCPINPDVHGLDLLSLRQLHVHMLNGFAELGARRGGHGCGLDEGVPARMIQNTTPTVSPSLCSQTFDPPARGERETAWPQGSLPSPAVPCHSADRR